VQRPDEALALEVEDDRVAVFERPARDAVVVLRHVAEDLQGQPEGLGEERGDAVEAAVRAGEHLADLRALVVRVRPVLDPTAASEERIVEPRDVAGGIDVRGAGPEVFVDEDAVVDRDAAALEERHGRLDADADDGQARTEFASGVQLDRVKS
jgi:hypothetical protein